MANLPKRVLKLKLARFEPSLFPQDEWRRGKLADAISQWLRRQFRQFGGVISSLIFTSDEVQVEWIPSQESDTSGPIVAMLGRGEVREAIILMELLLSDDPDNTAMLYNLGMAYSDTGALDRSIVVLRRLLALEPANTNARVALGVALTRQEKNEQALVELQRAVSEAPDNPWAQRNLGACLLKLRQAEQAVEPLRKATELNPTDERAWYGLAQALELTGDIAGADAAYIKVLDIDEFGEMAELARQGRTELAGQTFRTVPPGIPGAPRMDAVMYCLGALERFEKMTPEEVQRVGFEIALLGKSGLDVNNSAPNYRLRTLPGEFSGLHLVSIMYVAFQQIAPGQDVGFNLAAEYEMALAMRRSGKSTDK